MIEAFKLRGHATRLGYVRGPAQDGGWFYEYVKVFPSIGVTARLLFSGNGLPEENRQVALGRITFETLSDVPPVLASEVYADMAEIASHGTVLDPAWRTRVR